MNTLVIHPKDKTTDFLSLIYKDKNYDVVTDYETLEDKHRLKELIYEHDKIIILGHGTPMGLLNPRKGGYIIDDSFADFLNEREVVSIWCYSDQFFKRNNIYNEQFHTGMIISETLEQLLVLGDIYLNKEQQLENMEFFSILVGECIDQSPEEMKDHILENYTSEDPVTQFNRESILVF